MMRFMMFMMMMMVTMARGERMTITSVSEDLMVRRGESVNMTCQTDQVTTISFFGSDRSSRSHNAHSSGPNLSEAHHIVKPESEVPKSKVPKSRAKGLGLTQ